MIGREGFWLTLAVAARRSTVRDDAALIGNGSSQPLPEAKLKMCGVLRDTTQAQPLLCCSSFLPCRTSTHPSR